MEGSEEKELIFIVISVFFFINYLLVCGLVFVYFKVGVGYWLDV